MDAQGTRRGAARRTTRRFLLGGLASLIAVSANLIPGVAFADSPYGVIEDEGLAVCVNASIGGDREPLQEITEEDLKKVKLQFRCATGPGIKSFAGFEGATGVISIFLDGPRHQFTSAADLSALSALPKLRTLYLNGVGLTDDGFSGLGGTAHLQSLTLASLPELSDLTGISGNTGLTSVKLTPLPALSDLEPLRNMTKVTELDLSDAVLVSDLGPLSGMTELQSLTIQNTSVEDLTPLKDLRKLAKLAAAHAKIRSLVPLTDVESLTDLWLVGNDLTSLDGLEKLSKLSQVYASENALSGGIQALANKPNLKRLEVRQTQTTSLAMLADSQQLEFLDASDNRIASLQGLPVPGPGVNFHIASQNIHIDDPKQYVPEGATTFRVDAVGQVSMRDGVTFPQLYEASSPPRGPVADPELPILLFSNIRENATILDYKFKEGTGYNSFGGDVTMQIVRSSITSGTPDPIEAGELLTHAVTVTEGFPVTEYALDAGAPDWLQIDPVTGAITGTPMAAGEYTVGVKIADRLGNTINGSIAIAVTEAAPELEPSVVSIGADQRADAGDDLTFTVTRENASENPWTGEASVNVATADGSAVAGTDYEKVSGALVWEAGDTGPKTVTVKTTAPAAGAAAAAEKTFTVTLSGPSEHATIGSRADATGTIVTEKDGGGVAPPESKPDPKPDVKPNPDGKKSEGDIAHTGAAAPLVVLGAGAAFLLVTAGILLIRRRARA